MVILELVVSKIKLLPLLFLLVTPMLANSSNKIILFHNSIMLDIVFYVDQCLTCRVKVSEIGEFLFHTSIRNAVSLKGNPFGLHC